MNDPGAEKFRVSFVLKFKYNRSAEEALAQLREKHYADAFASDGRRVYYVGVNYNPAADVRTIDDVKCERTESRTPMRESVADDKNLEKNFRRLGRGFRAAAS